MRRRDIVAAALGAVAATVLAGGVAWAAIPGEGGVYTACMLKNVGTVRLIDKSLPPSNLMSHCKPALETEISWNRQGPQGLQGIPGQNGANGADGQPGAQGPPGDRGPQGDKGEPGVSGYEIVSTVIDLDALGRPTGQSLGSFAICPTGKRAVGGGVQRVGVNGSVSNTRPLPDGNTWAGSFNVESYPPAGLPPSITIWAICTITQ